MDEDNNYHRLKGVATFTTNSLDVTKFKWSAGCNVSTGSAEVEGICSVGDSPSAVAVLVWVWSPASTWQRRPRNATDAMLPTIPGGSLSIEGLQPCAFSVVLVNTSTGTEVGPPTTVAVAKAGDPLPLRRPALRTDAALLCTCQKKTAPPVAAAEGS